MVTQNELLAQQLLQTAQDPRQNPIARGVAGFLGARGLRRAEEEARQQESVRREALASALGQTGIDPTLIQALPTSALQQAVAQQLTREPEAPFTLGPGEALFSRSGDILAQLPAKAQSKIGKIEQDFDQGIIDRQKRDKAIDEELNKVDPFKQQLQQERKLARLDSKVEQFSKRIESTGIADVFNAFQNLDRLLPATGDIPGFGVGEGGLPGIAVGAEGRRLRQELATLRNTLLNLRSGAAVSEQEAARLEEELGVGAFSTEAQLRQGVRNARRILENKLKNVEAGFNRNVVDEFSARGGLTLKALDQLTVGADQVDNNGQEPVLPAPAQPTVAPQTTIRTTIDPTTGRLIIQ